MADFQAPAPEVFASAPAHYRMRAEFRIWHEEDELFLSLSFGSVSFNARNTPPKTTTITANIKIVLTLEFIYLCFLLSQITIPQIKIAAGIIITVSHTIKFA